MEERIRLEEEGKIPRDTLFERIVETETLDGTFLQSVPRIRRAFYRLLPADAALAVEAYLRRKQHRVVITWTDTGALLFALFLKLTGQRHPHVAMMFWISKPKKAFLLRMVHSHIDRIILWTSVHRDFAIRRLGIPESKIIYIPHYVDQKFWAPVEGEGEMICSAGREMRDYPTLVNAMRDVPIRCHIAAGLFRDKIEPTVQAIYRNGPLPPNVTAGKLGPRELRDVYARSRFVVVPLLPSDSDNGLNVILEAMAMGKAVICSRTDGQRDVIIEGETGIFVPVGDPAALRRAILDLWADPSQSARLGAAGRRFIEDHHTLDAFVEKVKKTVEKVAAEHNGYPES
jgi:glycosyltransferase involved in cell wall biosynthesis